MLEKAFRYIVGLSAPTVRELNGQTYSDKQLYRIRHAPKAKTIDFNSLSSLVTYLMSGVDVNPEQETLFIHVESPTRVSIFSSLDGDRERERLISVSAKVPCFNFGSFYDHENFCIALQSKFVDTADRALLLKFAGTVEAGSVAEYGDDGVTQKATVKTGIASKGDAIVPSPVLLTPYRTFIEVEQPTSSFVFRMKEDRGGGIACALFEADGGAWEMDAMRSIEAYLREAFEAYPNFVVLS